MPQRIGMGTDLHRLEPGEGIMLGGVRIPCGLRAVAHSDGDALLHACTDALLGAIGAGDIGELFPDNAPENRGRNSADFLCEALRRVQQAGYRIGNLDTIVNLQSPKLAPHKAKIRENLARLCRISPTRVNLKAKTGEGIGIIGRGEAVEAQAVVLLLHGGE